MKKLLITLLILTLAGIAPDARSQQREAQIRPSDSEKTMTFDVAIDARAWRLNDGTNPFDPLDINNLLAMKRGTTFIVRGKVYPGGTIPAGGTPDNPSAFGPDSPGSIGNWVCRGTLNFDFSEILQGAAPHVATTQIFLLSDGAGLWTDGLEGGVTTTRAVIGGIGEFSGASGEVVQETLGVNATGLFNLRFTFKIKKKSIK